MRVERPRQWAAGTDTTKPPLPVATAAPGPLEVTQPVARGRHHHAHEAGSSDLVALPHGYLGNPRASSGAGEGMGPGRVGSHLWTWPRGRPFSLQTLGCDAGRWLSLGPGEGFWGTRLEGPTSWDLDH